MKLVTMQTINYIIIVACVIMAVIVIYWVATGTDAFSVDNKNWNEAKKSCDNLKSYLLDHYGEIHYDQAKARWSLLCSK